MTRYHTVGVNVAVNTDYGLFTPLIPLTDTKGLVEINQTVKELADKARAKKLTPADLEVSFSPSLSPLLSFFLFL